MNDSWFLTSSATESPQNFRNDSEAKTIATVDTKSKESVVSFKERTDVTAVPAMGVVAESMVAIVLASESLPLNLVCERLRPHRRLRRL